MLIVKNVNALKKWKAEHQIQEEILKVELLETNLLVKDKDKEIETLRKVVQILNLRNLKLKNKIFKKKSRIR